MSVPSIAIEPISDLVQTAFAAVAAISTVYIAVVVHLHTVRRDKAAVENEMWRQVQEWNIVAAGSEKHRHAWEMMVYGGIPADHEQTTAMAACIYFCLNRINQVWIARRNKIFTQAEFEAKVQPTCQLLAGQKTYVPTLLANRGYDRVFAQEVIRLLGPISAAKPITYPTRPSRKVTKAKPVSTEDQ